MCFRISKVLLVSLGLFFSTIGFSQWREIYKGTDEDNAINGASFISPSTGFLAFTKFIGFTTDSGRTYSPRYVRYNNIDFNNFSGVNLTFGFEAAGVHAFSTDSLLIFGDFGWEPAILFSANQGQTWKLVYHKPLNPSAPTLWNAVVDLKFQGSVGLAIHHEGILKTTNRGQTWSLALNASNSLLQKLSFPSSSRAFVIGGNKMYGTYDAGANWYNVALPTSASSDNYNNVFFLNSLTGYISQKGTGRIYKTGTGGGIWTKMNDEDLQAMSGTDMYFTNDSTGFMTSEVLYEVYKTSDNGKTWERCKRNSDYQYLYYGMKSLFFYNNQIGWAGGLKEYLMINTTGSFPTFPRAGFKVDTNGVSSNNNVKLLNYSKPNYQYQWYKDGVLIGTSYNINYTHDRYKARDSLKLIVSNGTDTDSLLVYQDFTVPVLPLIASFSPTEGSTGTVITIKGKNFNSINNIKFGGVSTSFFTVLSDTVIRAIVGDGATGNVSLLTTSGSVSLPGFTFIPPPTAAPPVISAFFPSSGPIGTTVTISGQNFEANANNNVVYFGAVKAKVISASSNRITCTVPFGASYSSISLLNNTTHLTAYSIKPFAVTFADTSNFTENSFTNTYNISFPSGKHPKEVGAADFDGDGKPDLIATHTGFYDSIAVFRNTTLNGDFSFAAQQTFADISYYGSGKFVTADFDGDGATDIVGTTNSTKLVALKNTSSPGTISFARQFDIYSPYDSWSIIEGDLDNDGRPDLVVGNPYKVSILKNIGYPGTISFGLSIDYTTGGSPFGVAVGDLDGDGWRDIVSLNTSSGNESLSIFKNQSAVGVISFAPKMDIFIPGQSAAATNIKVIDFDGDNKLDILVAIGNDYSILKNTSTGSSISFAPVKNYNSPVVIYQSLSVGILNGDDKPDAAFANWAWRGLLLRRNVSNLDSVAMDDQVVIGNPAGWSTECADFNMDGKTDIVVGSANDDKIYFFKNTMGAIVNFNVCKNGSTSIEADLSGSYYQWQVDTGAGFINLDNNGNYFGVQSKRLYLSFIPLSFDGYKYRCIVDGKNTSVYQIKVKPALQASVTITATDTAICSGNSINFNATAVNGGDYPSYKWQLNGKDVGTNSSAFTTNTLQDNDKVRVILYSSDYCSNYSQDTSNVITVHIKGGTPSVSIRTSNPSICSGTFASFFADTLNIGNQGIFQWQVNDVNAGTNSATFGSDQLKDGDIIKLRVTNITTSCVSGLSLTSNIIRMTVSFVAPSVAISPTDTSICSGNSITFTATSANGGTSPVYQWQVNGSNVGANSTTYSTSSLTDGNKVSVILTSSAACALPQKDTSDIITIKVKPSNVPPSVTITSSATTICQGNPVTFTATTTDTSAKPAYQWMVNGVNFGTNSNSYTTSAVNSNDQVTVIATNTMGCSKGASATSNTIVVNVTGKQKAKGNPVAPNAVCANNFFNVNFKALQTPVGSEIKLWSAIDNNGYTAGISQNYNGSDLSFTVTANFGSTIKLFFSITPPASACFEAGNTDTVNVQIDQFNNPIIVFKNRTLSITNPDAAASYSWQSLKNTTWSDIIPAVSGLSYNVSDSGSYRVKANKAACTQYSNVIVLTSDSLMIKEPKNIYVYPNPTTGILVIDSLNLSDHWETLNIVNSDNGQKVASYDITGKTSITLYLQFLAPGMYIAVFIRNDGTIHSMKFVKI